MLDATMWSVKNDSVHSCQFAQHTKFYCLMATLKNFFKNEIKPVLLLNGNVKELFQKWN